MNRKVALKNSRVQTVLATTCTLAALASWSPEAAAQAPLSTAPTRATDGNTAPPTPAPAVQAAQEAADGKPWAPPATFGEWASGIKLGFQAEGGIVLNTRSPNAQANFGQLFTDKPNRPILNQALLTAARDIDPAATSWDFGFKFQAMYGSDARIIHTLGVFDQLIHDRNQLAVVEANVAVRVPIFQGGMDVKGGIYPTPLGVEVIDPKGNVFYSKSYIFNYGLPFKHTGVLTTSHVSPMVDIYAGVDSGVNTSLGSGDNNDRPGGIAGIGLNLLGGNLTVLALTHIGPENSTRTTPFGNSANRFLNDVAVVWKATDKLTFTTELNYARDEGFRAEAYGIAQYASYALTDSVTLSGRAEVFRDNNNFFVSNPRSNRDYVNAQLGNYATLITAPSATTYSEFTAGITYKPQGLPGAFKTLMLRPEVRYDRALNDTTPYANGRSRGVITASADIVLGF